MSEEQRPRRAGLQKLMGPAFKNKSSHVFRGNMWCDGKMHQTQAFSYFWILLLIFAILSCEKVHVHYLISKKQQLESKSRFEEMFGITVQYRTLHHHTSGYTVKHGLLDECPQRRDGERGWRSPVRGIAVQMRWKLQLGGWKMEG